MQIFLTFSFSFLQFDQSGIYLHLYRLRFLSPLEKLKWYLFFWFKFSAISLKCFF